MTTPRVGRFVDGRKLVVAWLGPRVAGARVLTRLPANLSGGRFVWVASVNGTTNGENAQLRLDVQSMVPGGDGAAGELAELVHGEMGALGGQIVGDHLVNEVRCVGLPTPQFWSPDVDRLVGTYELDLPVLL